MQKNIDDFLKYISLNKNLAIVVLIIVGILGRLIPHIPNVTPLVSLSLFVGARLSRQAAILSLFITLFISDICLALLYGYTVFGYWTLFTYTGFMLIVLGGSRLQYSGKTLPVYILSSSFVFWVWSNFGVWLLSDLYPKTLIGLNTCYITALPFLRNSLVGDMIWGLAIFGSFSLIISKVKCHQTV